MQTNLLLPKNQWIKTRDTLFGVRLGEDPSSFDEVDIELLQELGFLDDSNKLTEKGEELCVQYLVRDDPGKVATMCHTAVLALPSTQLFLQSLWGLEVVTVDQVKMVFNLGGLDRTLVNARITAFLLVLNTHGVVVFNRRNKTVKLIDNPVQIKAPDHIYIDRSRPYSNELRIREIIRECEGTIYWIDKYFQKEAFEWLFREATATKVNSIVIISVADDKGVEAQSFADFKRFRSELEAKGISVQWRVLERSKSHDFHDRWVLDAVGLCYNLPSVGSIKSGQRSELHRSPNFDELTSAFSKYLAESRDVTEVPIRPA